MSTPLVEPVPPTQVVHPWRATIRTVISVLLGIILTVPPGWAILSDEMAKQGLTLPDSVQATVVAVVAVCLILTGTVQRLILIPRVADWVHSLGLGPTPKG